jgi:hypothetical protein
MYLYAHAQGVIDTGCASVTRSHPAQEKQEFSCEDYRLYMPKRAGKCIASNLSCTSSDLTVPAFVKTGSAVKVGIRKLIEKEYHP